MAHHAGLDTGLDEAARGAHDARLSHARSLAVAVVIGAGLAVSARAGATPLLAAIAVVQFLLALAWVFGTRLPGRKGALIIAALAAAGADVAVSVWPSSQLGTMLAVLGLAVPVLFVHQLTRGAARVRIVDSLGGIALLVLAEVALPALLQLRHQFGANGGHVVAGVVVAAAGALAVGHLVDLLAPMPRFDPEVPRGLLGVLASAGLGGSLGYLMLQSDRYTDFLDGRGAFLGACLGVLVALFAVGLAFVRHNVARPEGVWARRRDTALGPVLGVTVPLSLLAPVAFLLCLAIRA